MSEIGSTRSLDRTASAEPLTPTESEASEGKSKTLSTLDKRGVSGAEVGQARGVGKKDGTLAPSSSGQLVAKSSTSEGEGSSRLSRLSGSAGEQSGASKISSEYSTLQGVAQQADKSGGGKSGADGTYSVLNPQDIAQPATPARQGDENYANTSDLRPPTTKVDTGHYETAPKATGQNVAGQNVAGQNVTSQANTGHYEVSPNAGRGAVAGAGTISAKAAPPLPLRSGDFLPGGGIDTLALKGRFMREGAYLANNPSASRNDSINMGVRIFDRQAIAGKPRMPRFTAAKKFFSAIKNLFSRQARSVPRDVMSDKSRFSNEIAERGKAQGLGKNDQKQVIRISKDIDSIINKGRQKDGITAKQHSDVFTKNAEINNIFAQDAKRQGIDDGFADPTYASVEGDYATIRSDT